MSPLSPWLIFSSTLTCGGRNRARTCDLRLVRPALPQLSYPPDALYTTQLREGRQAQIHPLCLNYARQLPPDLLQIGRADDMVAVEDASGFVPGHRHRHPLRNSRIDHVPNRRPPEIMT
jgi:hypothetical protein